MYATREYIQLLASGLADQSGITIKEGKSWSTDLESKTITYVMNDLNNKPFGAVRGLLLHELGHIKHTNVLKVSSSHPYSKKYGAKIMGSIYNCFEDWRIENRLVQEYGAYARGSILEMNYTAVYQSLVENNASVLHLPKYHQFLMIASYAHLTWVHPEINSLVGYGAEYFTHPRLRLNMGFGLDEEVAQSLLDSTDLRADLTTKIIQANNIVEVQQIVDAEVMPILKKLLDEDPPPKDDQKQQQQQQQSGGASIKVQMSGGSQGQQSSGGQAPSKPEKEEKQPQQSAGGAGDPKQEDKKDEEEDKKEAGAGAGQDDKDNNKDQNQDEQKGSGGDADEEKEEEEEQVEISIVQSLKNSVDAEEKPVNAQLKRQLAGRGRGSITNFTKPTVREAQTLLSPYSITLANRLVSILRERESTRWTGNHLSGRLLGRNAYKVLVKDESRIFSKRSNPNHPKYSVHIAVDSSGSMQGERALYAFMGAVMLQDVSKKLGFETHLYRYDEYCTELNSMEDYKATGGGTYDQSALEKINRKLTTDGDKLIFMITDGDTSRDSKYKKLEHEMLAKNVTLVGIGIGNDVSPATMKAHYPVGIHVAKVEELPMVLINTMRQIIHR